MIYSIWGAEGMPESLIEGSGPPMFTDGEMISANAECLEVFERDSVDEAIAHYDDCCERYLASPSRTWL